MELYQFVSFASFFLIYKIRLVVKLLVACSPDRTSDNSYGFKMKDFECVRFGIGIIIPDKIISITKKWKKCY